MGNLIVGPEVYFIQKRDVTGSYCGIIVMQGDSFPAFYSKQGAIQCLEILDSVYKFSKHEITAAEDAICNSRLRSIILLRERELLEEIKGVLEEATEFKQCTWEDFKGSFSSRKKGEVVFII